MKILTVNFTLRIDSNNSIRVLSDFIIRHNYI